MPPRGILGRRTNKVVSCPTMVSKLKYAVRSMVASPADRSRQQGH